MAASAKAIAECNAAKGGAEASSTKADTATANADDATAKALAAADKANSAKFVYADMTAEDKADLISPLMSSVDERIAADVTEAAADDVVADVDELFNR